MILKMIEMVAVLQTISHFVTPQIMWLGITAIIIIGGPIANAMSEYILSKSKPRKPTPEELDAWVIKRITESRSIAEETGLSAYEIVRYFSEMER